MKPEDYIKLAGKLSPLSDRPPDPRFRDFYRNHDRELADHLLRAGEASAGMSGFTVRAGMMPPDNAVIDEKVRNFCQLPYRTPQGNIPSCPGITRGWKACPPHSPDVTETIELLGEAGCFLIVQLEGNEDRCRQGDVHLYIEQVGGLLQENGYVLLETYASGPCSLCPQRCGDSRDCRQQERRLFALESCGFWVDQLCRKASDFPVLGDGPRLIRWIKDWGLTTQDTMDVRYTTGILISV